MIKVLIVDDEPLARKRVHDLLRDEPDVQILGESGDGLDAREKVRTLEPDLLFLDIKMPGLTGLELSRLLHEAKIPCIIFTTAYSEHAVDAFGVDAVDYLLKPFDKQRLHEALARARKRLAGAVPDAAELARILRQFSGLADNRSSAAPERLAVKDGTHIKFLVLNDITHMQSEGDYLHIHSLNGEHAMIRERMRDMEQRLSQAAFMRISRSLLVNTRHILEMKPTAHGDYEFMLPAGERLVSGKTYREAVRALLAQLQPSR
ncbi:MAG TPA: LytTR family DNA-binding domain-containing protein [Gammaproteobacteria bacterium]|nr:LytTR family DNA-binding domain-containing protein [Gammaproteobacteria bacterium]